MALRGREPTPARGGSLGQGQQLALYWGAIKSAERGLSPPPSNPLQSGPVGTNEFLPPLISLAHTNIFP